MVFSLLILAPPAGGSAVAGALRFAAAALDAGHQVRQVFFHGEGVGAVARADLPADEPDLDAAWARLAARGGFPLLACETALARRGLDAGSLRAGAVRAGTLGQFMLAMGESDRVLTFAD
jgi:tRNA 2-thiouridine synthesizing protein D